MKINIFIIRQPLVFFSVNYFVLRNGGKSRKGFHWESERTFWTRKVVLVCIILKDLPGKEILGHLSKTLAQWVFSPLTLTYQPIMVFRFWKGWLSDLPFFLVFFKSSGMNTANISVQYRKHHDVTYSVFRKKVFFHNLSKYVVLFLMKRIRLHYFNGSKMHIYTFLRWQSYSIFSH